jgi:hypothetical protein
MEAGKLGRGGLFRFLVSCLWHPFLLVVGQDCSGKCPVISFQTRRGEGEGEVGEDLYG